MLLTGKTHLEMMQNEDLWPRWPFLPLIRGEDVGILIAGRGPVVYRVNLYDMAGKLATAEQINYPSYEAMVASSWVVD